MIDSLILWPSDSENNIQEIFFEKNKVNIIHGISGTGKSSIISIIDYCLGSSK
ncbi:AAA family ATPase [Providencia stuartii]